MSNRRRRLEKRGTYGRGIRPSYLLALADGPDVSWQRFGVTEKEVRRLADLQLQVQICIGDSEWRRRVGPSFTSPTPLVKPRLRTLRSSRGEKFSLVRWRRQVSARKKGGSNG
jgi:hypothetical protein